VVLHHGVMGVLEPQSVYSNPAAVASPWRWALIRGAFVLAASATHMASWRTNEQQLLRDALTGLPSRLMLMTRLSSALARLERSGGHVAVLFIDLDRFQLVNDSLGHHAGDTLLLAVTERLRKAVRRHEMPARFGGDEFVLVCEDVADAKHAVAVAERLLKALALPFDLDGSQAFVSDSIGIALTDDHVTSPDDLVRDADAAMYHAKEAGGGRWSIFDQVIRDRVVQRQATEAAADRDRGGGAGRALPARAGRGDRRDRRRRGARAVGAPRGRHGRARRVHPDRRGDGAHRPIGRLVLREACRQARTFDDDRLIVRVNVSARQLSDTSLTSVVADALAESELPPERLCLEVTESVVMEDAERAIAALHAIRDLGVSVAWTTSAPATAR
jgi:diguanylate cyclase (GGDEF)-like protein